MPKTSTARRDSTATRFAIWPRTIIGFRPSRSQQRAMKGLAINTQIDPSNVKLEPIRLPLLRAALQAGESCASPMHGSVPPLKNAVGKAGKMRPFKTPEAATNTTDNQNEGQPLEQRPLEPFGPSMVFRRGAKRRSQHVVCDVRTHDLQS